MVREETFGVPFGPFTPTLPKEFARFKGPLSLKAAAHVLARTKKGSLRVILPDGRRWHFGGGGAPYAVLQVIDPGFAKRPLASGDVGFAEGYMAGEWNTPDLTALLAFFSVNFDEASKVSRGGFAGRIAGWIRHALNANTRTGAKKNIHAHYDLGNAFYGAWLDETMTYSSAIFESQSETLVEGQARKYRSIAGQLRLKPGDHVLEIGSGWGGFAEVAAKEFGARVTSVTISEAQHAYARKRMADAGLSERADIQLKDYRDIDGEFDAVASIEMFEAVGEKYWPEYFGKIASVLKPEGRAALQIITIEDALFESYRGRADFIQRYVFPGGMLPSVERLTAEVEAAGLRRAETRMFGQDYARTLGEWRDRFEAAWDDIRPMGFDERFRRLWNFYLAYCEAGFATGRIDVGQFALTKG